MKKQECGVCPGCSRQCCADAPRCKYGKKYFAEAGKTAMCRKWKKKISRGGLIHRMLKISRQIKKSLKKNGTEAQLLKHLSPEEQASMLMLLEKLNRSCAL